ncbi:unnamed protein product, partial [Mesorhabditis spiculigera]
MSEKSNRFFHTPSQSFDMGLGKVKFAPGTVTPPLRRSVELETIERPASAEPPKPRLGAGRAKVHPSDVKLGRAVSSPSLDKIGKDWAV